MLAVVSMGFAAYYTMVKSREGQALPRRQQQKTEQNQQPTQESQTAGTDEPSIPAFSTDKATVVFVLGGPSAVYQRSDIKYINEAI
ncbi:hypothetical protein BC941DRAFT_203813 [Chlamydoabsidia padenii]|nr:hypothetical protein BC941DRAFT_203813 [Chlamydoabsidia padenii]